MCWQPGPAFLQSHLPFDDSVDIYKNINEPLHNKTNIVGLRPTCSLSVSLLVIELVSEQHGSWSDCADAQAGLDPCWSQTHYVGFVMTRLISMILKKLEPTTNPYKPHQSCPVGSIGGELDCESVGPVSIPGRCRSLSLWSWSPFYGHSHNTSALACTEVSIPCKSEGN
jgi:hypothetical protein